MNSSYKRYASEAYVDDKFGSLTSVELNFTEEQKTQARANIGVPSLTEFNELKNTISVLNQTLEDTLEGVE